MEIQKKTILTNNSQKPRILRRNPPKLIRRLAHLLRRDITRDIHRHHPEIDERLREVAEEEQRLAYLRS